MRDETGQAGEIGTTGDVLASACEGLRRPRQHRLLCRPDFTRCYDTGRRYFSRQFVIFVHTKSESVTNEPENTPQTTWRVGFAVTKKTGNAVVRNRIKRVLREFFRLHQGLIPPTVDVVVTPKRVLQPKLFGLDVAREELLPVLQQMSQARRAKA